MYSRGTVAPSSAWHSLNGQQNQCKLTLYALELAFLHGSREHLTLDYFALFLFLFGGECSMLLFPCHAELHLVFLLIGLMFLRHHNFGSEKNILLNFAQLLGITETFIPTPLSFVANIVSH